MGATFEIYEDSAGRYRWRLVHDNGNIIADGGEGYTSKEKALQSIKSVRNTALDADIKTK
ncbi:HVO_2922 family protein [Halobacterium sp. CBA1132]|uniref:HVO_2922 family protein n=1 Tax=Halobacterium TaxID=2239 RepID=UPI0009E6DA27